MPYVMVPVPEEHIEVVLQFVLGAMKRAAIEHWDESSIADLFAQLDEPSQVVLSAAARGVLGPGPISAQDAAEAAGISKREAAAIVFELNVRARDLERPMVILFYETEREGADGEVQAVLHMNMAPPVASMVCDADRMQRSGDGERPRSAQDAG